MPKLVLLVTLLSLTPCAVAQRKPVLYVPLGQAEFAHNLIKECPAVDLTCIQEKADFVVGWGTNEKENRNDWVVYTIDGKVIGSGEATRVSATARDICKSITK